MSRKANRLKARLRIESDNQQRWLRHYHDAKAREHEYRAVAEKIIRKFGRYVRVDRERDDEVLVIRYAITRREADDHRFVADFVQAVTESCLEQLRRALDSAHYANSGDAE